MGNDSQNKSRNGGDTGTQGRVCSGGPKSNKQRAGDERREKQSPMTVSEQLRNQQWRNDENNTPQNSRSAVRCCRLEWVYLSQAVDS
jgi:hypothetical protein